MVYCLNNEFSLNFQALIFIDFQYQSYVIDFIDYWFSLILPEAGQLRKRVQAEGNLTWLQEFSTLLTTQGLNSSVE